MNTIKTVGLITIHGIDNFGSLFQAYATQRVISQMGYKCMIINYKYPNDYHIQRSKNNSPYASVKLNFQQRVRQHFYRKYFSKKVNENKHKLYDKVRADLLKTTELFESIEALQKKTPLFDIYLTGSDQVWNPRYLYEDTAFLLSFVSSRNKIAYSASFGATEIDDFHQSLMEPLLTEYRRISTREQSGVKLVHDICGKDAICTCDPTLLLNGKEWKKVFDEKPLIEGDYILCYILTYTANPYPYAYKFVQYIKKALGMKVVFIDEDGLYWGDFRNKSLQVYGPNDIINLFSNASFIISSSFHGAAFSINLHKDFFSIFPKGVKDERQESLLKIVGASDRLIRVGDPFPSKDSIRIKNWDAIENKLDDYVSNSKEYLRSSLELCSK